MKKWIKTLETIKNEAKTIDQHRLNIDQTSTKYRSKKQPQIDQKSTKNRSKIEVWKAPGQVWRLLGPAWAIKGVLRAILDRFGTVLEASWAVLGRERWPTWEQLGIQTGAKIVPKIDQF